MIKNQIASALYCLTLFSGAGPYARTQENMISTKKDASMNIQNLPQEYLEDSGTPGTAIALIVHEKMQFFYSGKMTLEGKPVNEEIIFEIGLVTKEGDVQLDDSVEMHLG